MAQPNDIPHLVQTKPVSVRNGKQRTNLAIFSLRECQVPVENLLHNFVENTTNHDYHMATEA